MNKTSRDMPSFLDQDRPAKVKEIYRALKRDHPEMPAEMKARIAARQGKKGKQHQGPPYKGALTKQALEFADTLPFAMGAGLGLGGYGIARAEGLKGKPRIAFGLGSGLLGAALGEGIRRSAKQKMEGASGPTPSLTKEDALRLVAIHDLKQGKAVGASPEQQKREAAELEEAFRNKTASLKASLDVLHAHFGPPMTKHAALNCLYQTQKPELDTEALTPKFCKLATASRLDPWDMAYTAVKNYSRFEKLAAHTDPRYRELGQFYLNWADEMVKRASILRGLMNAPTALANVAGTAGRALKAGGGAVRGQLSSAKSLAQRGMLQGEVPTVRRAIGKSLQESKGLIAEGGGSLRRGRQMVAQHGPAPTGPVVKGPPPAAPKKGWSLGKKLIFGTGMAGAGAGGAAALGAQPDPAQLQYQPAY